MASGGYMGYALRFISGKYQGGEFPLKAEREVIIGRSSDLDLVLVEDMVSRKHAKIITGQDYVILQDLGSTNGSFVNGERVRKVRLREGDRILVGTSILKLVPYTAPESPELLPGGVGEQAHELSTANQPLEQHRAPETMVAAPAVTEDATYMPEARPSPAEQTPPPARQPATPDPTPVPSSSPERASAPGPAAQDQSARAAGGMVGYLEETPLPDILELFSTSRKNGVLVIRGEKEGRIHLRDGRIVFAIIDNNFTVGPLKSVYRALTWSKGTFELLPPNDNEIHEEIDEDIEDLLMEALRQQDEMRRHKAVIPPHTHNLSVCMPLRSPLRDLSPERLDTLQLVYNYGILETILNKSKFTDLESYEHLAYLLKHDFIKAH